MHDTISALEEKVEQDPYNKTLIHTLGDIYFSNASFLKASKTLERIIEIDINSAPDIILQFENKLKEDKYNRELLLSLVDLHMSEGVISEALEELSLLLDLDPHDQRVLDKIFSIVHKYKKGPVIPVLEKAVKLNVENSSLLEVLAGIYLDKGDLQKAILLYESSVTVDEKNLSSWLVLAELYAEHENIEKSHEAFKKVIELSTNFESLIVKLNNTVDKIADKIPFLYLLAEAYVKSIKPDEAIAKYRQILSVDEEEVIKVTEEVKKFLDAFPDYPEGNFLFADVAIVNGSYSEAITVLKKVIEATPQYADRVINYLERIIKLCPKQVYAYQTLGDIYLVKSDFNSCLSQYDMILEILPEEADYVIERARAILKRNPNIIKAREVIAKSMLNKRQYRKAIAEAEAIIAIDQNNASAYLVLARSRLANGESDFARKAFQTAMALDPYNKQAHIYYKQVIFQNLDKMIFELSKHLEKDPWKYSTHYECAMAYFQRGLIKEAIGEFQIAVKDAEKAYEIHKLQGLCFKEMGRYDLAVAQYEKALSYIKEKDVEKWKRLKFYIGLAYEAQGEHKRSLALYEQIMTQDIDYENIQLRMDKLKSFSWVEIRGKALAAVLTDYDSKEVVVCWAKNSESDEFNKKNKKKNVDVSFSLEHNNKAVEHALRGRFKAAEDELSLAVQMDPKFTIVYNNLAVIALHKGELSEARRLFELALEHNNKLPILQANYAVLLYLEKEYEKADEYYNKALALDDTLFVTQINMGDLYYYSGDIEKAFVYWNRAMTLGVIPELAKRRLMYRTI